MTFAELEAIPTTSPDVADIWSGYAADCLIADEPEDRELFAQHFDRTPFQFEHALHLHPAFQLDALLQAAERLSANPATAAKSHYESGAPDRNAWFGARPEGTTLVEALASIQSGKNWVILKRIHEDPTYRDVLDEIIPQFSAVSGVDMAKVYYDPTMTIFITSPGRITPYHMDGETNFLAQIRGSKLAYIYDGRDPSVLSQADLERYWTGNLPKIDYPENLPHGHWQYTLEPGNGVFNPAIFPHWLQNGPDVSISVSMNFKRRHDATIGAHRTNRFLRRIGLKPAMPGVSPAMDRAKEATFGRLYEGVHGIATALKAKRRG
jgi:hypothetical protein